MIITLEYEILTVKTADYEMDYLKFGHGDKTMVIVPGVSIKSVLLSAAAIVKQYELFKDDFTVYLFDRKKDINSTYPVDSMADDTLDAIKKAGLSDVYGLGISQGGMIMLSIALKDKALMKKLVLGSTISRDNEIVLDSINTWKRLASEHEGEKLCFDMFDRIYSEQFLKRYKKALAILARQCSDDDCERFQYVVDACTGFDVYERLPEITTQLYVIGAENDKAISAIGSYEIAQKTGCGIYMYDDYGHAVYDEAPDYKQRVMDFYKA